MFAVVVGNSCIMRVKDVPSASREEALGEESRDAGRKQKRSVGSRAGHMNIDNSVPRNSVRAQARTGFYQKLGGPSGSFRVPLMRAFISWGRVRVWQRSSLTPLWNSFLSSGWWVPRTMPSPGYSSLMTFS